MAPIPPGTWRLAGDGEDVGLRPVVKFDIIWRHAGESTTVASITHTFVGTGTVPFATEFTGTAIDSHPGDQLLLVFTTIGGDSGASYTPNGDGASVGGAVPHLTLPP